MWHHCEFRIGIIARLLLCTSVLSRANVSGEDRTSVRDTEFHVVGYLPDYRVDQIETSVGNQLTDLVFFSAMPDPHGKFSSKILDSPKTAALLKQFRDEQKVKVAICVGGWERSQGFAKIAASKTTRVEFAKGLTDFCLLKGFAGADIDWEHPKDATETTNYGMLLAEIAKQFKPRDLRLTAAMAAWQSMTAEAIDAVDAIHLMSYDAEGKHSTLEAAKKDVQKLLDLGFPARKIRLGLPLYGRGITQSDKVKTYAEIVSSGQKEPEVDEVDGLYFNGPSTIVAKINFAKEKKLGGVMVWEIGQDASGDASLLRTIRKAAN